MNLDLSKYRKVASDENTTTLQHPSGKHEVKIANKGVPEKIRKQMADMPLYEYQGTNEGDSSQSSQSPVNININPPPMQSLPPQTMQTPPVQRAPAQENEPLEARWGSGYDPIIDKIRDSMNEGTANTPKPSAIEDLDTSSMQQSPGKVAPPSTQTAMAPKEMPPQMNMAPQEDPLARGSKVTEDMIKEGMKDQIAGAQMGVDAAQAHANAYNKAQADFVQSQQDFQEDVDDRMKTYHSEIGKVINDIANGQINSNHYMESMSSGQKVRTAIGLILGGMGGGLMHTENPAMKFLNEQIQRDVQSQRDNLDNKKTLFSAYRQQFQDDESANKMTLASQTAIYDSELQKAAVMAKTPAARAAVLSLQGQLKDQYAQYLGQAATRQAVLNQQRSPAGMGGQMSVDPAYQIRRLEVAGIMSPADAKEASKELGESQMIDKARDFALAKFNDLNDKFLKGNLTPGYRDSAINSIGPEIARATTKRYNADEANKQMNGIFPQAGDLDSTDKYKRANLIDFMNTLKSTPTLKKYGIDPSGYATSGAGYTTNPAIRNK